ncbi:MAG: hypothetical protein JWQ64_2257 [Subtercola sp.]|nr:hypothetical protein [Subtercola sp.]
MKLTFDEFVSSLTDMSDLLSPPHSSALDGDPGLVPYPQQKRAEYRAAGLWSGRTLPADLVAAARLNEGATAVITPERELTYGELFDAAETLAIGLLSQTSLRPGDAVMFQMGNVAETVIAYLACLLAGYRPVCTLPQHGRREVGLLAEHVSARGLFVQADFGRGHLVGQAQSLLADGSVDEIVVFRGVAFEGAHSGDDVRAAGIDAGPVTLPYRDLDPDQIAVFQLSGGTTGLPKVAPRLHEEYAYNARAWAELLSWGPGTVVLYPLPIMHNAGIALGLQSALLSGATLVLAPSAETGILLDLIASTHPVAIPLVPPAVAIRLLDDPRSTGVDLSGISQFYVGGQKLPLGFAERLRDTFGIDTSQKFGMAEGMFVATPPGASEFVRHHTVGAPISWADEVRIVHPGTDRAVEPGEIGEFCARGPYTIRGYYRAPAHNAASFSPDGFYRTGDLAKAHVIDGATYYSIEGRIKDVINRGAEKIHAEEVEEVALRHPSIANAAVVAMPDRVLGEKVCACLILETGAEPIDVTELAAFLLAEGLAKYKLPERVVILKTFPLTNVGKVSKKDLREAIVRLIEQEKAHA